MAVRKLRVLVVDDSAVARELVVRGLEADPGLEVVAAVGDAFQARDAIEDLEPDVMALDVEMPRMSGIDFLRLLIPQYPMPVVVMSAVGGNVFDAMAAGAVDFVKKPEAGVPEGFRSFLSELMMKLKIASTAKVGASPHAPSTHTRARHSNSAITRDLLAIGASTGGTEAIHELLSAFGPDCPPTVVVQHMPPVFTKMYADRLHRACQMEVREAQDGDVLRTGLVLVAAGDRHLRVVRQGTQYRVRCEFGAKVSGHCPSVDVLFESVAKAAGARAVGVILTGMGADGARGLLEMRKQGARTLGQNEATCVVYGMPMEAWKIGAVEKQLPLGGMPNVILDAMEDDT